MTNVRRAAAFLSLAVGVGCAGAQSILTSSGQPGGREAALGRIFTIVGIVVVVIVSLLLLFGLFRRRPPADPRQIVRRGNGIAWIMAGGVIVPAIVLVILFFFVLESLASTAQPPPRPVAGVFDIVGHRWWWEVKGVNGANQTQFVTANELHIPVGRPVRIHLTSADVIHSFWVPRLAGKTDVIPGQTNDAWLEADTAGVYYAYCAEYCGMQHAHMGLRVVAEDDQSYARWLADQSGDAQAPQTAQEMRGHDLFLGSPCTSCHAIRGTPAGAIVGPDLTHVASRRTIGAGVLPNTTDNLTRWISNSQALKPGNQMPPIDMKPEDVLAIVGYLHSLR